MAIFSFAPPEVRSDVPKVVLCGREEVLVEQHRGLYSYASDCIRLRTAAGILCITGAELLIAHFGPRDVLVRGRVDGVTLREEGL